MKKNGRKIYFFLGIWFTILAGFIGFATIMAEGGKPANALIFVAMAVMSYCLSYLYPHFKENDERVKWIKQKGMFASFIALFAYFILFQLGIQFDFFFLSALELLQVLSTLMICTVFLSFVIYSKIY